MTNLKNAVYASIMAATLIVTSCSRAPDEPEAKSRQTEAKEQGAPRSGDHGAADTVHLSAERIAGAGIETAKVSRATTRFVQVPAVVVANPERSATVSATLAGRLAALKRNVGDPVRRGDVLAIVDSRDAADLAAEAQAAASQMQLAEDTLRRQQTLFEAGVTAERELKSARSAAEQARIRARQTQQRLSAVGGKAGATESRFEVRSPIDGHIIDRKAAIGHVVAPDDELFKVADLSEVALEIFVAPDLAGLIQAGSGVDAAAGARTGKGTLVYVSPVISMESRQVRALATLPNHRQTWRIGETVTASLQTADAGRGGTIMIPRAALQTVEGKPSVFVRNPEGFVVRHLDIGGEGGDLVSVLQGLDGDEEVAVRNSYLLKAELGKREGSDHDH